MDTLIRNGILVTSSGISKADVAIKNGIIHAIGHDLEATGARIIDAKGCYVIPGGVDVHTHLATGNFGSFSSR